MAAVAGRRAVIVDGSGGAGGELEPLVELYDHVVEPRRQITDLVAANTHEPVSEHLLLEVIVEPRMYAQRQRRRPFDPTT